MLNSLVTTIGLNVVCDLSYYFCYRNIKYLHRSSYNFNYTCILYNSYEISEPPTVGIKSEFALKVVALPVITCGVYSAHGSPVNATLRPELVCN